MSISSRLEPLEAPGLVGVHDAIVVAVRRPLIEIDHAADEARREDADAAVVEQVDAAAARRPRSNTV